MTIDFSWSADDWMALIREFLRIIQNFFKEIGIDLFSSDDDKTTPTEGE